MYKYTLHNNVSTTDQAVNRRQNAQLSLHVDKGAVLLAC